MTSGLLDFFILEASEHVEQLDLLVARAGQGAPDAGAFARHARALRGSATMAKIQGIAEVAAGLERVAKALADDTIAWTPALAGAVVAAIDDLKILVRGVRTWGSAESARASERAAELLGLAPSFRRRSTGVATASGGSANFLAAETADVSAGLIRLADGRTRIATDDDAVRRLRALRGVAALLDLPPLAEVVAMADETVKALELRGAIPDPAQQRLLRAAAAVLREGSDAIHAGSRPDVHSQIVQAYAIAAEMLVAGTSDRDEIVPISALFAEGAGPHVIHEAPNPPTTPGERFRLEVVSQAEHLRRLVADARNASDTPTRQRLGHELRGAVRALGRAAESFGEHAVAMTLHALIEGASLLEGRALAALEEASAMLAAGGDAPLAARFEALLAAPRRSSGSVPTVPTVPTTWTAAPSPIVPIEQLAPVDEFTAQFEGEPIVENDFAYEPPRAPTPPMAGAAVPAPTPTAPPIHIASAPLDTGSSLSGADLHQTLGAGLAGLAGLNQAPLAEPVAVDDDGVVPIQDLLYRGPQALQRAIAIGAPFRASGTAPDRETLAELFDLLELATTE